MYKYLSPDLALYQQLLASYKNCLKNKPQVKKTTFHLQHERIIHQLALDIENRTYQPIKSNIFVVTHPKPREVIAAHLRDRIVHHFIYDYMSPHWERRFSSRSFACRTGKGPLQAVTDLQVFFRRHARQRGTPLFYLKMDIQSFFTSIDLKILYRMIERSLENDLYLWLCQVVIFHRATVKGNFSLTSPKKLWQMLPKYKSMFYAPQDVGLPIGNLTSQFFANVYMNHFDQYMTHQVKGRVLYWQRYVDDILLLSDDPRQLRDLAPEICSFMSRELNLKINPKKTILQPLSRGLNHLGYFLCPDHTLIRRRVWGNCQRKVNQILEKAPDYVDAAAICATVNSYLGHFRRAASNGKRKAVTERLLGDPHVAKLVTVDTDSYKLTPVKKTKAELRAEECSAEVALQGEFVQAFRDLDPVAEKKRGQFYLKNWQPIADLIQLHGGGHPEVDNRLPDDLCPTAT